MPIIHHKPTGFYELFRRKTEEAKGRRGMLISSVLSMMINNLTGGVFYSGFLLGHGIDIVNIGILTFIPYIATLFSLFSPLILERFSKRKYILAAGRMLYYVINILGLTLLPELVSDPIGKTVGFGIIVFAASVINHLFLPGYTVWNLNFLPEHLRADYFTMVPMITNFLSGGVLIFSSAITDLLADSPHQLAIITALRYLALAIAVADVAALTFRKEYPYEKASEKTRIRDSLVLPIRHKKFMLTMFITFFYTFTINITGSVLNTWMLEDVGASYTFINAINASFFLFFLFFRGVAKNMIRKYDWFYTFVLILLIHAPSYFLFGLVDHKNYLWLMLGVRLFQHFCGVITNAVNSNLLYINLPRTDRTCYITFHTLITNLAMFLSLFFGTFFVKFVGDASFFLFGVEIGSVQMLLMLTGVLELILAGLVVALMPRIDPEGKKRMEERRAK